MSTLGATSANATHILDEHQLLMPGAVVVHHREHGQPMMLCGPQHTRRIVEIAVSLDVDHDLLAASGSERGANRRWRAIPYAAGPLSAKIAVGLIAIPQLRVVRTGEVAWRSENPVLVNDQRPELCGTCGRC